MAGRSPDLDAPIAGAAPEAGADGGTAAQQQQAAGGAAAEQQQSTPLADRAEQQAGSNEGRRSGWPSSQSWYDESWRSRSGWNWDSEYWHHKESDWSAKYSKDEDVPSWDGESSPLKTYFRKIDIWLVGTRTEPERRALRLLESLTGDAFDKLELVDPKSLYQPDGVDYFKKIVWDKYEPMERHRAGRVMDKFFDAFN